MKTEILAVSLVLLCSMLSSTNAAVSRSPATLNPEYPDMCWSEDEQKAYAPGSNYPEGGCLEVFCDIENLELIYQTCGVVAAPGYHNIIDYSKPYPECCINLVQN